MTSHSLQDFIEEVNGDSRLRVEHDFGGGYVRLRTSEADRRQAAQDIQNSENIVLELLRNSRDAHARHIFLATAKEGSKRSITIIDDGDGIPLEMHELIFEPRVTSKLDSSHMDAWGLHGRGMALYSITQTTLSAKVLSSDVGLGACLHVVSDVKKLPEKADQSSFPRFTLSEEGAVNVRGPRNILRNACEFAIESRDTCAVYVGTPSEILAAIYAYGVVTLSAIERAFCADAHSLPLVKRLATASDPSELASMSAELGLAVSQRTARRILDGEIEETVPLLDRIRIEKPGQKDKKKRPRTSIRNVKLHAEDKAALAQAARESFHEVAQRYYLEEDVDPQIRVSGDKLSISIPLVPKS